MTEPLRAYVTRAQAVLETPPTTVRETGTWLVEPFLAALGWLPSAIDLDVDRTVGDLSVTYRCRLEGVPVCYLVVDPAIEPLTADRAEALATVLESSPVDRGVYTNGRQFVFFSSTPTAEPMRCSLAELPSLRSNLDEFSPETFRSDLLDDPRSLVARRLSADRETVSEELIDVLHVQAMDVHREDFLPFVDSLLSRLIEAWTVSPDEASGPPDDDARSDDTPWTPDQRAEPSSVSASTTIGNATEQKPPARFDAMATPTLDSDESPDEGTSTSPTRDLVTDVRSVAETTDGEFVVKFFDGGRSIGAIGHSTSPGAFAHAVEYLFERGLSGIDSSWETEDGEVVLTRDDRFHHMVAPYELSTGYVLDLGASVGQRVSRLRELASWVGLRVMFVGDWGP